MSKGFVLLAQNSQHDYVEQACLCAMSIKANMPESSVTIVTNDGVPLTYQELFDNIKTIPWTNSTDEQTVFATTERWKLYHVTPYDETIVLDTDMLVLQDISSWWNFLSNYDLYYASNVTTYRGKTVTSDYYRKTFSANNLPNLYNGFHYFKKCEFAHEFYKWLELVTNNWELFYSQYAKEHFPKQCSMDVSAAIVSKILNCEDKITNSKIKYPSFTHMKPYIQEWQHPKSRWQDKVGIYLTSDLKLTIGNHLQQGIFHYTEKDFVTNDIIARYKLALGINND